jgi:hypothetical protein
VSKIKDSGIYFFRSTRYALVFDTGAAGRVAERAGRQEASETALDPSILAQVFEIKG